MISVSELEYMFSLLLLQSGPQKLKSFSMNSYFRVAWKKSVCSGAIIKLIAEYLCIGDIGAKAKNLIEILMFSGLGKRFLFFFFFFSLCGREFPSSGLEMPVTVIEDLGKLYH